MLIKNLQLGQMEANCYIVTDENTMQCVVIDPGDESNTVLDYIEDNKLAVKYVFLTHGHFDHTMAAETVSEETGAPIYICGKDISDRTKNMQDEDLFTFEAPEGTLTYKDGDRLTVGELVFEIIETPGHSKGSVTIKCENCLFTGDTLFHGGAGRVDFPGGDMVELILSLKKLGNMQGDFEVYPGHMDSTRLDVERNENPFMQCAMGVSD